MIEITDLTLNDSNIKRMKTLDTTWDEVSIELRTKGNKFYICCAWESSGDFEIKHRFLNEAEAKKMFQKFKNKKISW